MKGGCEIYPNRGVKVDPRAKTSVRMPESLKVYSGYLTDGYKFLMGEGMLRRHDIEREGQKIKDLQPLFETHDKFKSSYWFISETHIVEFFRTSIYNYKVYALRIVFLEESPSLLQR